MILIRNVNIFDIKIPVLFNCIVDPYPNKEKKKKKTNKKNLKKNFEQLHQTCKHVRILNHLNKIW